MTPEEAQAILDQRAAKAAGGGGGGGSQMTPEAAQKELNDRAVKARSEGSTLERGWSDTNDIIRMIASGATYGGSDYIAAAGNTALGNIGSTLGLTEDPNFADEVAKQDVEDSRARARINSAGYPIGAEGVELASGLIGPAKVIGPMRMGKMALAGGAGYLANKLGGDPLKMYGGYAAGRDILSKVLRR